MSDTIPVFDLDDYRALRSMAESNWAFAAKIGGATLMIVEACRDAEVRAASAEAALEAERGKLAAVMAQLAAGRHEGHDPIESLSNIARIVG